jgi:hypothetical protein
MILKERKGGKKRCKIVREGNGRDKKEKGSGRHKEEMQQQSCD